MTVQEIVREVFEGLGEPADLDFYLDPDTQTVDYTGTAWARMISMLNTAQLALCTWKFADGRQLRLRLNEAATVFESKVLAGTVAAASGAAISISGTGMPAGNDALYGWLVVGPSGSGIVLNSTGTSTAVDVVLYKLTGSFTVADAVTIALREYTWLDVSTTGRILPYDQIGIPAIYTAGHPLEIIDVVDSTTETSLDLGLKYDHGLSISTTPGSPATMYKIPQGIRFDVWPSEERLYEVRYIRGPRPIGVTAVEAALEPELPVQFHAALVLYGLWWGYRRAQESGDAYSVKRDLEDTLRRIRTEYDLQDELTPGQVKFYPEGR